MQIDPAAEWLRLTSVYGEMGDIELRELEAARDDLTEIAQQVLRDEMRKRGLKPLPDPAETTHFARPLPPVDPDEFAAGDEDSNGDQPEEFTWKTQLCECLDRQQAMQLFEVLRRAGIQSWIETSYSAFGLFPRIFVAADQLEHAREIADRPISQGITDDTAAGPADYEPPHCPKCNAEDPVLESADPANQWFCEACGAEWTDLAGDPDESSAAQ